VFLNTLEESENLNSYSNKTNKLFKKTEQHITGKLLFGVVPENLIFIYGSRNYTIIKPVYYKELLLCRGRRFDEHKTSIIRRRKIINNNDTKCIIMISLVILYFDQILNRKIDLTTSQYISRAMIIEINI
jgi:hypothetical protein